MSFSVLIVGLGQIGMGYDLNLDPMTYVYTHARAFNEHPQFYLIGGVDPDAGRRDVFSSTYGCPAYGDLCEALEQHQPTLVVLAMPTPVHEATLLQVLKLSDPKAVLCEKPLAYKLDEATRMVEASATRDVCLYVNYMRRSDQGVIECRRRLDAGEIATPLKGAAWYSKGFLHNGSHLFNLLEYWLGPMQSSVVMRRGRLWGMTDSEPDVHVTFERGTVVFQAAWEEAFSHYTIELVSPTGRLRYEEGGKVVQWQGTQRDLYLPSYTVLSPYVEKIPSGMRRYQWHVAEQLALALSGKDAGLCTGVDALRTLVSMKRILEEVKQW
jgi:predicted dehydrogenase